LDQELAKSGCRLNGLVIDDQKIELNSLEEAFSRNIDTVQKLDLYFVSIAELTAESLLQISGDIDDFEKINFEDRAGFYANWKDKPQAVFAADIMPDIFALFGAFISGSVSSQVIRTVVGERLREIADPAEEFLMLESQIGEICERLTDLPLDMQIGKDLRAAQTIQIFSGVAEKIFRIVKLLPPGELEKNVTGLISEFGAAVKEILAAYERRDTVMIGDISEYEISPKLRELYSAIMKVYSKETV
jgi:hypothetical protein